MRPTPFNHLPKQSVMKRLVQVASEKGGVGKSHLTANLAQYYFDHGVGGSVV